MRSKGTLVCAKQAEAAKIASQGLVISLLYSRSFVDTVGSRGTPAQCMQICDQVLQIGRSHPSVGRHQRRIGVPNFAYTLFLKHPKLLFRITQLDRERVLVDSDAANLAPIRCSDDDASIFLRNIGRRIDDRFANVLHRPGRTDTAQIRTKHTAVPSYAMTAGASVLRVDLTALDRIPGNMGLPSHTGRETLDISNNLADL